MDEPIDAKKLTYRHPVLGESAGELDGGGWRPDLGHVKVALEEVQNGGDVFGQRHRRQSGDVLVLPNLRKFAAQALQHHVDHVIRSGGEPSSEVAEEGVGIGSHTGNVPFLKTERE
ncbi:hypothetical protein OHB00_40845 [Streptomyces sp. NBC_00631]|uniref:hypothetical protein n=1 Tax=Streptomyces sp. NBC_00631 TaxID=2975793 RepID=UPI0030DF7414